MSVRAAIPFVLKRGEDVVSLPGPALADPSRHAASSLPLPVTDPVPSEEGAAVEAPNRSTDSRPEPSQ